MTARCIKTIPITAGAPSTTTYNGQMVISEKYKVTRMNGATVGFGGEYDIKDVPHAMRLSQLRHLRPRQLLGLVAAPSARRTSATAASACATPAAAATRARPAAWFFNESLIGDVVVVKNSKDKQIAPDNGLNGWNMAVGGVDQVGRVPYAP